MTLLMEEILAESSCMTYIRKFDRITMKAMEQNGLLSTLLALSLSGCFLFNFLSISINIF